MRQSFALSFLATANMAFAAPLHAKPTEHGYSREYRRCMESGNAARGVTVGIMSCTGLEIDRQDARLNQVYKAAMKRTNARRRTTLRSSERAWIAARDAKCRKEADAEGGGSLSGIVYNECILEATVSRRLWLESYR